MADDLDLVSQLSDEEAAELRFSLECICPDDAKYRKATQPIRETIAPLAEWNGCVHVQEVLLETRKEFGCADDHHFREMRSILERIDPPNISLLEGKLRHDQQAVIAEIGRFVSLATKARIHPGTTSYDILDTTRAHLLKKAWFDVMRPQVGKVAGQFCSFAGETMDVVQVGRTHLQNTSPVLFGAVLAGYVRELSERVEYLDRAFGDLRGKIRGMVGTGAPIEMVVGKGRASEFEGVVLDKLGLKPDYAATQITQKKRYADVGNGLVTLAYVLGDWAGDVRHMYASAIRELVSSDSSRLLGGSSADAAKDNPINWENMEGKLPVVESGMRVLYEMCKSTFQRVLCDSVQGRYQPQMMIAQVYEMFVRAEKAMGVLSVNKDRMSDNLVPVREFPSEAMVAILRGRGWYDDNEDGHDFVKRASIQAKSERRKLLDVALEDDSFRDVYGDLSDEKKRILGGEMELYLGDSRERARGNLEYAMGVFSA